MSNNEKILSDLKTFEDGGIIEYVLPTEPLGEEWLIGWNGEILKFTTAEGIIGFIYGVNVCAHFTVNRMVEREDPLKAMFRQAEERCGITPH